MVVRSTALATVGIVAILSPGASSAQPHNGIALVEQTLAEIKSLEPSDAGEDSGTAFVIASNDVQSYLLTAAHNLCDEHEHCAKKVQLVFSCDQSKVYATRVAIGRTDAPEADFALLVTQHGRLQSVKLAPSSPPPHLGLGIGALGFGQDALTDADVYGYSPRLKEGELYQVKGTPPGIVLDYDVPTTPGMSGSPIFDEDTGSVIGLHRGEEYGDHLGPGPVAILRFLRKAGKPSWLGSRVHASGRRLCGAQQRALASVEPTVKSGGVGAKPMSYVAYNPELAADIPLASAELSTDFVTRLAQDAIAPLNSPFSQEAEFEVSSSPSSSGGATVDDEDKKLLQLAFDTLYAFVARVDLSRGSVGTSAGGTGVLVESQRDGDVLVSARSTICPNSRCAAHVVIHYGSNLDIGINADVVSVGSDLAILKTRSRRPHIQPRAFEMSVPTYGGPIGIAYISTVNPTHRSQPMLAIGTTVSLEKPDRFASTVKVGADAIGAPVFDSKGYILGVVVQVAPDGTAVVDGRTALVNQMSASKLQFSF